MKNRSMIFMLPAVHLDFVAANDRPQWKSVEMKSFMMTKMCIMIKIIIVIIKIIIKITTMIII